MTQKILYYDCETTINNKGEDAVGKHQASPYHPDNEIVYEGWLFEGDKQVSTLRSDIHENTFLNVEECCLFVAHNSSFDLSHLLMGEQGEEWMEWIIRGGRIWDTQVVEYLLTGQDSVWPSLDDVSEKYGGTVKDSRMKEYWKAGVCTKDIPADEIIPYLEQDVLNLQIILEKQLAEAYRLDMMPLIESQMDARLATIGAEYNGMAFDQKAANKLSKKLQKQLDVVEDKLRNEMAYTIGIELDEVNPGSTKQLSAMLFGGTIDVVRDMPALDEDGEEVVYKSGKRKGEVKTKKTKIPITVNGQYISDKPLGRSGSYPVGDDIITKLPVKGDFVTNLRKYRELKKQLSTYFDGYAALVYPDGCLHGSINHCATVTGRMSSSNPNLQNISNKESKE
jgi:DNA polymerase I-like protein with 3'-5' exonuclease and polymerase domains